MLKLKTVILFFFIVLIIFFNFALKLKDEKILIDLKKEQREINKIMKFLKKDINNELYCDTKLVDGEYIEKIISSEEVLKMFKSKNFSGCFKIGNGELNYYSLSCSKYVIDDSISYNPFLIDNFIPVRYENNNYIKTNYINWYNYSDSKIAYAVIHNNKYEEGDIILESDIKNIFVWIPAFYYDEKENIISYKPIENIDKTNYYKHTTSNHLPFAFYYRNDDIYGFWLQIDDGKVENVENNSNIEIHSITQDEIFVLDLFQSYYSLDNNFKFDGKSKVIIIGRGNLFYEK